jgi:uncharacterized protein (DUF2141 family)
MTMIKIIFKLGLLVIGLSSQLAAEILIINVESNYNQGLALVGVYDKESNFGKAKVNKKLDSEKVLTGAAIQVVDNKAQIKIDIPFGFYAVSGFQDIDGNLVMSGNFLGIPKEPFGFSNNAKGKFGPPKWRDAVFNFNKNNQVIILKLEKL